MISASMASDVLNCALRYFLVVTLICFLQSDNSFGQTSLPAEKPVWPGGTSGVIQYPEGEAVRSPNASAASPSKSNRVFSRVDTPTYVIHAANQEKANGVGLVICPGGGYYDVWLDREGHDLAIWLKDYGITSLVLKYRTNASGKIEGRKYKWDEYLPQVTDDARQAVRILRKEGKELGVDPNKVGISGFSAGGNLALQVALLTKDEGTTSDGWADVSGDVNFAGLFYPWLRTDAYQAIDEDTKCPPLFIMNAADDFVTPASKCIDFYGRLLKSKANPELHIVSRGGHGFDLGDGRKIQSAPIWKQSFVAWMHDAGLIE